MESISVWDEKTAVVSDWKLRGIEDGLAEGRELGPQKYWRLVAWFNHPELPNGQRRAYVFGFLRGMRQGVREWRARRVAVDDELPTLRYSAPPQPPTDEPAVYI